MRVLALGVALAWTAGCDRRDSPALWRDAFESVCGGAPCGWTQVAGPRGAVTYVETLPGKHGVEMVGSGVAISRLGQGQRLTSPAPIDQRLMAHVVARCDPGSSLTIIVSLQNFAGGRPIDVSGTTTFPPTWDGTRTTFRLVDPAGTAGASFNEILAVVLHKEGPGVCEVDYISLADRDTPFRE